MTIDEVLGRLEALGHESIREQRADNSAAHHFGVRLGDIRKVASEIRGNHDLAMALWETDPVDARLLAILLMKPRTLTVADLDRMVRSAKPVQVADWFNAYIVRKHPQRDTVREAWMSDEDPWAARSGWDLTAERIGRNPEGLDLAALLDRIEADMATAAPEVQWTMNNCLAAIGIRFPEHRPRALSIGERLGIYRDYPVSRGCTSPFAPIWINEMVKRQGST